MAVEGFSGPGNHEFLVDMARANGFAARDLEANRVGKMTRSQLRRVFIRALRPMRIAGAALLGWMLMIFIIHALVPGIAQAFLLKKVGVGAIGPMIGVFGAFIMAVLKVSRRTFLLMIDAVDGKVALVMGRVAPSFEERQAQGLARLRGDNDPIYHYCIRDDEFEVNQEAWRLLVSKYDTYRPLVRIYYTPRSHMLLTVEPVEGTSAAEQADGEEGHWTFAPTGAMQEVHPTYFAVRRNFDTLPRQLSAPQHRPRWQRLSTPPNLPSAPPEKPAAAPSPAAPTGESAAPGGDVLKQTIQPRPAGPDKAAGKPSSPPSRGPLRPGTPPGPGKGVPGGAPRGSQPPVRLGPPGAGRLSPPRSGTPTPRPGAGAGRPSTSPGRPPLGKSAVQ
ncbi:MAG: hypothetical protein R2729_06855 [Bryobacteraceae bacterium]